MSAGGGHINPNIPQDYQPAVNDSNFSSPAHGLTNAQKEQIVEIAEQGHGHGGHGVGEGVGPGLRAGSGGDAGYANNSSSGLGHSSGTGIGSGLGSSSSTGLGHSGSSGLTGNSSGHSRTGSSGLAAAAGAQGFGGQSAVDRRSLDGGERPVHYASSGQPTGQQYGQQTNLGQSGSSNTHHTGATAVGTGALAGAGAGAAGYGASQHGSGNSGLTGNSSSNNNERSGNSMLSQPTAPKGGLAGELEARARAAGTHSAGFGVHGNH